MSLADVDARLVTAISLWVIGFIVTGFTVKVWWTHPINRAFLFGPYLTEEGLRLVLRAWPILFLLGALALTEGASRFFYWLEDQGAQVRGAAAVAGLAEAALSLWAAGSLLVFAVRGWRKA